MASGYTRKSRPLRTVIPSGVTNQYSSTGDHLGTIVGDEREVIGSQITDSEGHNWKGRNKRSFQDIGGPFYTSKRYVEGAIPLVSLDNWDGGNYPIPPRRYRYAGPLLPASPDNLLFPPTIHSDSVGLDAAGATAIARCKPTNSVADASVFLGELLKDGVPSLMGTQLWKDKTSAAQKAGSEYLNVEFGWKPIVNDVNKFIHAVHNAETVLKQYERDAGKMVRRNYELPVESESYAETIDGPNPSWISGGMSGLSYGMVPGGPLVRFVTKTRRQWFSGGFTYYLPTGYDSRSGMAKAALKAKKLFGLTLTPDTVWNVSPWSWAVDWFSNTGDVISNLSDWATDGLVLRYGYVMEHTVSKYTYTRTPSGFTTGHASGPSITLVTETKVRRRANPFGFGLTWDGLTPRQIAITAALGITRR